MILNKNLFCASNPAMLCEALWYFLSGRDFANDVIFLPSRRAIRAVEKFVAQRCGGSVLLPQLVALGESDEEDENPIADAWVVSNQERVLVLAKLLSAAEGQSIASVLPVARNLVQMQDYIENENQKPQSVNWLELVDEKFANHFQKKAQFLSLADNVLPTIFPGKITSAQKRNADIRAWTNHSFLGKVIVCGSTASVPATADLMTHIASLPNGIIILPGKIVELEAKGEELEICNPYYSEYKFLRRIGVSPDEVQEIDVGESNIEFFNSAFSNTPSSLIPHTSSFTRIDCAREAEEAEVAAEIAARAESIGKSVLVITPDAAGNQRLRESFARRALNADFSGGLSGGMTLFGRQILNKFDEAADSRHGEIKNLFEFIDSFNLEFSESDLPIIEKLKEVSDIFVRHGIAPSAMDARAVVLDALSSVQIRPNLHDDASVRVLGTIESRMQSADVIILTGLNEGMFPALGYENPWLPRRAAQQIGLPPPQHKVSLMALDFINLSCGKNVYWLRSKNAGGAQTTESRFLSRISVADKDAKPMAEQDIDFLQSVRSRDNVSLVPLDLSAPMPPMDWSAVYVTELELLIHNPYAFYAQHILRLKPKDDWWVGPGPKEFGILVHLVIENYKIEKAKTTDQMISEIISQLDSAARQILPQGSVVFYFWHKRFTQIAPAILQMLNASDGGESEIKLETKIAGRIVRAKADRVWDSVVLDIKTGSVPNKSQLEQGNMPQLPLEAFMRGAKVMQFLQLQNNNVKLIEYSGDQAQAMINSSVQKVSELFGRYSKDAEPYEYFDTSDPKYKAYDDLARAND